MEPKRTKIQGFVFVNKNARGLFLTVPTLVVPLGSFRQGLGAYLGTSKMVMSMLNTNLSRQKASLDCFPSLHPCLSSRLSSSFPKVPNRWFTGWPILILLHAAMCPRILEQNSWLRLNRVCTCVSSERSSLA